MKSLASRLGRPLALSVLSVSLASAVLAAPRPPDSPSDRQTRLDLMESRGAEASLTILPVLLGGRPFEGVNHVIGLMLERHGLKHLELGEGAFAPTPGLGLDDLAGSVGAFVSANPIETEYALYGEFNGSREAGLNELRAVVVDSTGAVVWTTRQTSEDEPIRQLKSREPMTFSMVLAEQIGEMLGLNDSTAAAAKPGRMAELMQARSGLPPDRERAAMPARQAQFKETASSARLEVRGVRVRGAVDSARTAELAALINDAGLCRARAVAQPPVLDASQSGSDESRVLWNLARAFRDYNRETPTDADYALYADYVFDPRDWQHGYVHFVVCDRTGEWVIVDLQNNNLPDYQAEKPTSAAACSRVLVRRLKGYLK